MAVLELTQDVDAPAQVLWDAVVDWRSQGEWMLGTDVRVTRGDGESVGSTLAAYSGVKPLGFLDTMVITEWDPPRQCTVRHTGRLVRGLGVFTVRERGEGRSTFVWREELDLPLGAAGRLAWPLARVPFAWGVRYSLRQLARHCEQPSR